MKNILLTGNIIFLKINSNKVFHSAAKDKYMLCTISGILLPEYIYTYSEIKEKYSNIQEFDDLRDILDERLKQITL